MNIFVRNLAFTAKEGTLKELFQQFGEVSSCKIITDRQTGKSRGYGFVEMPNEDEAKEAIQSLNNEDFVGRPLAVSKAKPKESR